MRPIRFEGANVSFSAPGCEALPARRDSIRIQTRWQLTDDERQAIAKGGCIMLSVFSVGQPPVALAVLPKDVASEAENSPRNWLRKAHR
jgi:hypothetical protein